METKVPEVPEGHYGCWRLHQAFDRHMETHWFLHQLNENYHNAQAFRFSLNAVLRSLKEVPDVAQAEVKDEPDFATFFRPLLDQLRSDPLYKAFATDRNALVHDGMLIPKSQVHVGVAVTRSRGVVPKLAFPFGARPEEDSDDIMARCVEMCRADRMLAGLLSPQDEEQIPCVWRTWRLTSFPDEEVRVVVVRAWQRVGEMLAKFMAHLGYKEKIDFNPPCLEEHLDARWTRKKYPQELYKDVPGSFWKRMEAEQLTPSPKKS